MRRGLILGLAIGCGGAALGRLPAVLRLDEAVGLGSLFAMHAPRAVPTDVAVIGISQQTFEALNVSDELDEWPRSWHARLLERLSALGPAAILVDLSFTETRDPEDDDALSAAIEAAGNVILLERTAPVTGADARAAAAAGVTLERRDPPLPSLRRAALGTAPFTLPSVPIRLSQFWIFDRMGSNVASLPALALQAYALDALPAFESALALQPSPGAGSEAGSVSGRPDHGRALDVRVRSLRDTVLASGLDAAWLGARVRAAGLPASEAADALVAMYAGPPSGYLRYYGPPGSIETIPYEHVIDGTRTTPLTGRAVFVGISEITPPNQQDVFYSVFSDMSGRNLSGVEIGATAFANLLHRDLVWPLGMWAQILLLIGWGLVAGICAMWPSHRLAWALCASAVAAYLAATGLTFVEAKLWLPTFVPLALQMPLALLIAGLWKYATEARHRSRVQQALESYAPQAALARLPVAPVTRDHGRRHVEAACIVTDVHGYTALAERLDARVLADLMNEYFESLFDIVARHDGIVTDTAGDSMVAVWEYATPEVVARACAAALAIDAAVAQFNRRHTGKELATGIGLERGEIMLANIGSMRRFNYHAVGNAVNTAARIQGLTGRLDARILVSERGHVAGAAGPSRYLGEFWLAGKTECVGVYELGRGLADGSPGDDDAFAQGLAAFRAGEIGEALACFRRAAHDDGPARFYRSYCETLLGGMDLQGFDGRVFVGVK